MNLNTSLVLTYEQLHTFAQSFDYWTILNTAFGTSYDSTLATTLQQQWQARDFSALPPIQILSGDTLGNANGAYAVSTNTIYLAESFLATATSEQVTVVLLEEIGHYIDAQINSTDTPGDEGELFTDLLLNRPIALKAYTEDDSATLTIDGQIIAVEQNQSTFNNSTAITIPSSGVGVATPYPSTISVSGLSGAIASLQVTLNNINHTFPNDIDVLLVGPTGAKTILMSDAGGGASSPLSNTSLTFSATASQSLTNSTTTSGTYRPTDFSPSDTFSGAPGGPYTASFTPFIGTDPNGTWSLYVVDDTILDSGSIAGGWSLSLDVSDVDEFDVSTPIDTNAVINEIAENAANGSTVGVTANASDADGSNNTVTYSLTDNAGGRFAIDANTGVVTVADGTLLDFETATSQNIIVQASSSDGSNSTQAFAIAVTNINEAPTITSGASTNFAENGTDTAYTVVATDPDAGTILSYSISGTDEALFNIDSSSGNVTFKTTPNFEAPIDNGTNNVYDITVVATDAAGKSSEQAVSLAINNLDEVAPTITSGDTAAAINENSGATQVVYQVTSTDTDDIATGSTTYSLKNVGDFAAFTINGTTGEVTLTGNPDHETKPSYSFTVVATDAAENFSEEAVNLEIDDVNEAPTSLSLTQLVLSLPEDTQTNERLELSLITIFDDALGNNQLLLTGNDANFFEIVDAKLFLKAKTILDFETRDTYTVTIELNDPDLENTPILFTEFKLAITDVNERPTMINVTPKELVIVENTHIAEPLKMAEIEIVDDDLGSNFISINGRDAEFFEIKNNQLFIKADTVIDFEDKIDYQITLNVSDPTLAVAPIATTDIIIKVINIFDEVFSINPPAKENDSGEGTIFDASNIVTEMTLRPDKGILEQIDAEFHNLFGLYQVLDASGAVQADADLNGDGIINTNDRINPGDTSYALAALKNLANNVVLQAGANGDPSKNSNIGDVLLDGGKIYSPFMIANGGDLVPTGGTLQQGINKFMLQNPDNVAATLENFETHLVAYFGFGAANPDGTQHLRNLGDNTFGFEDLPGNLSISDFDFNDAIIRLSFFA